MAHFRRRLPATRTSGKTYYKRRATAFEKRFGRNRWMHSWPAWHDIIHHRRPRRRATRALEIAAKWDRVDLDEIAWPLAKRPHVYYW